MNELTYHVWAKLDQNGSGGLFNYNSGWNRGYRVVFANTAHNFNYGHNADYLADDNATFNYLEWYLLSGTFKEDDPTSGTNTAKVFINGVLNNSRLTAKNLGNNWSSSNPFELFRADYNLSYSYPMEGSIGRCVIMDRAQSESEILDFYNTGYVDPTDANLICDWQLNEGTGTAINDSGDNSNDGTKGSGLEWVAESNYQRGTVVSTNLLAGI